MKRRQFISLLGAAAVWPLAASAQQLQRMRHVGLLMGGLDEADREAQSWVVAFREELGKLGWTRWPIAIMSLPSPGRAHLLSSAA
jgi:putative tryptophan/tyrosine transport system substrate-binding protein